MNVLKVLGLFAVLFCCSSFAAKHPYYMSVTEVEHNAKNNAVEIICKIFTDDFEKTLRTATTQRVDLYGRDKRDASMDKLVSSYIANHLQISVNGKKYPLSFVGYEVVEEAAHCYFEIPGVTHVKQINIKNDLLYEYKKEQFGIMHVTVILFCHHISYRSNNIFTIWFAKIIAIAAISWPMIFCS
jgi:hypothetical protein